MRRFVDISVPLQAGIASDPPGHLPEIDYYDHKQTDAEVVSFFPGAKIADLPDGEGWAIECVRITTHNGTHGGKRAITIDEVPLEWCLQPPPPTSSRNSSASATRWRRWRSSW